MTPETWRRVKEVFDSAAEVPSSERVALLEACEPDVRAGVEQLLALRREPELEIDRHPVASPALAALAAKALDAVREPRYSPGELIAGRYRVRRFLAAGGMGQVYEACDEAEARDVALKFIHRASRSATAIRRLEREVSLARKIDHPRVCRMYGLGEHEGERFCVMAMLQGETLAARLERGALPPAEALPIALQICDGLQAAHEAGVLHRDLKPGNVFLEDGQVTLIDFGLAAGDEGLSRSLTESNAVIGTLAYLAPEQFEGVEASRASDIYALGVLLHEMITGTKPYNARGALGLVAQVAGRPPVLAARPAVWRQVIERCLACDPAQRPASALQVRHALARGRASAAYLIRQALRRYRVPVAAALLAAAGGLAWNASRAGYRPVPEAAQLWLNAQAALAEASPLRASRLLETAVSRDPEFIAARAVLATAYAETDQYDGARDALLEASAVADRRWLLGQAERLWLTAAKATVTRNFARAGESYTALASVTSGRERGAARMSRVRVLDQAGRTGESLAEAEQVVRDDPANHAARVQWAILLCRTRQYDRAAAEFARAEAGLQGEDQQEALADLLLARSNRLRGQAREHNWRDLHRIDAIARRLGSHYHSLQAKFLRAELHQIDREYDRGIALAREAVEEARAEGLPVLAAQAMGTFGYAFLFQKQIPAGIAALREAVALAGRAKSPALLAENRWRLGEALNAAGQPADAVAEIEPAIAWLRQAGRLESLPLVLVKYGTALNATPRFREAEPAWREALAMAEASQDRAIQLMALGRLLNYSEWHEPRHAGEYAHRLLALDQTPRNLIHALEAAQTAGKFPEVAKWLGLAETKAAAFPEGVDRLWLEGKLASVRARHAYNQGNCFVSYQPPVAPDGIGPQLLAWQLRHCRAGFSPVVARAARASLEFQLAVMPLPEKAIGRLGAAEFALFEQNWSVARNQARGALEFFQPQQQIPRELTGVLILRAAARGLGDRAEFDRLTAEALRLAGVMGFDPPERFGSRQDLLRLWGYRRN